MSREERTVRGKVIRVVAHVYTPHNIGTGYLVQVDELGCELLIGTNWSPDPLSFETDTEVDIDFRGGQVWRVKRAPVAAPPTDGKPVVEVTT